MQSPVYNCNTTVYAVSRGIHTYHNNKSVWSQIVYAVFSVPFPSAMFKWFYPAGGGGT